jgi:hypothetical protein
LKSSLGPKLYLALTHYPVVNKEGECIASAVTPIDLHDMARAARTYGARKLYVITPLVDQQALVGRILAHWTQGAGAAYNPARRQALELVRLVADLAAAEDQIAARHGLAPITVATCARRIDGCRGYSEMRRRLADGRPHLIIFGTAWGLAPNLLSGADYVLAPVQGATDYNHLSVRSAAAVILDRLTGVASDRR